MMTPLADGHEAELASPASPSASATNSLRPALAGPPELAYRVAGAISRVAPRADLCA